MVSTIFQAKFKDKLSISILLFKIKSYTVRTLLLLILGLIILLGLANPAYGYKRKDVYKLVETNKCIKCDISSYQKLPRVGSLNDTNLRGSNCERTNFSGMSFNQVNLSNAKLIQANLSQITALDINLQQAQLNGADLSGAKLNKGNLTSADLSRANLQGIDLSQANLQKSNLSDVDLREAGFYQAKLENANLTSQFDSSLFERGEYALCQFN